jgi:hypothetical protein
MRVLERLIQQVKPGQWQALEALDQTFDVVEKQLGFPVKRRYRSFASSGNTDTLVIEREWESLAVMEAAWEKLMTSAEYQKLDAEAQGILSSNAPEIFMVL